MKINESDIAAEFETLREEINELRQHVLSLTEVVQGINGVLHDLNKQILINSKL
jgi:hypothetical protein